MNDKARQPIMWKKKKEQVPSSSQLENQHNGDTPPLGGYFDSDQRRHGLARLAVHHAFAMTMEEADERLITREEAIARMTQLAPAILLATDRMDATGDTA